MSETTTTEVTEDIPGSVKLEILSSLNVEPMTTPLADVAKLYREQVDIIDNHNEKVRKGTADDEATKSAKAQFVPNDGTLADIVNNFADALFRYVESNPASVMVAESLLTSLKSDVVEERKYRFDSVLSEVKRAKGITETQSETATTAYTAHLVLLDLINMRKNMVEQGFSTEDISPLLSLTKGGKRRFDSDAVPNKRTLDSGEGIRNVGRSAKHSRTAFTWTTREGTVTNLPLGTTIADIAHTLVSQGSYRVSRDELLAAIKAQGDKLFTEKGDTIHFSTGTLAGRLISE